MRQSWKELYIDREVGTEKKRVKGGTDHRKEKGRKEKDGFIGIKGEEKNGTKRGWEVSLNIKKYI